VQAPNSTTITMLVLIPLVAWRMYARVRRVVGRQTFSKVRPWITLAIFPALIILLSLGARSHPQMLEWLAVGICVGAALGLYGLKKTQFEATAQGLYYTPNAHLGIALSVLFISRMLYRFFEVYSHGTSAPPGMDDMARSPLTLAIFGLLAGYYMTYAIGLLRWHFQVQREPLATQAVP
jgi:hypothetical protein